MIGVVTPLSQQLAHWLVELAPNQWSCVILKLSVDLTSILWFALRLVCLIDH